MIIGIRLIIQGGKMSYPSVYLFYDEINHEVFAEISMNDVSQKYCNLIFIGQVNVGILDTKSFKIPIGTK